MKPTPEEVIRDATKLESERFQHRNNDLEDRHKLRFRRKEPKVPTAYADTAIAYKSPALQEEGRQIFALVDSRPVPHVVPPSDDAAPLATLTENFIMAAHQRLEDVYGSVRAKVTMSQIHEKVGIFKYPLKRAFYKNAPTPPDDTTDVEGLIKYNSDLETYKKDAGIEDAFEYNHVPTATVCYRGDPMNPLAVYEVKEIDETDLLLQYSLTIGGDGKYVKVDSTTLTTTPPGERQQTGSRKVKVVEYWDRDWCLIVVGTGRQSFFGFRQQEYVFELDAWEHGWGEVPYAFAPAFETEVLEEEYRFESPLDPLYAEIDLFNQLVTMLTNVGHLTGYPSWQKLRKEEPLGSIDTQTQKRTVQKYQPGQIYELEPGDQITNLPMNTGSELRDLALMSQARLQKYSVSEIAKGISPGADTANSAIAQLKRQLKSSLDPMVQSQVRAWRRMYQFWLRRIKETIAQPVYVYDAESDDVIELDPEQIPTYNVQVRQTPEAGTDLLIEEKQAADLTLSGLITPLEFHERRGKENPEDYERAAMLWRFYKTYEPTMFNLILANLGAVDAQQRLIAQFQQSGNANDAVAGIMQDYEQAQNGVLGSGSAGMPRDQGVRSPAIQQTTQPGAAMGGGMPMNGQIGG